jgi:hypothetical protein
VASRSRVAGLAFVVAVDWVWSVLDPVGSLIRHTP